MTDWIPAVPSDRALSLGARDIHVWRVKYQRSQGHVPFRALLASYLDMPADALVFKRGAHGRPYLDHPPSALDFNWSHSGSLALVAIARDLPFLGMDFERRQSRPRALSLARRFFDPAEYARLRALPSDEQEAAFLRLWTAKEAVLKALGRGIGFGLDRVCFDLDDSGVFPVSFAAEAGPIDLWRLQRIDDAHGYACLAWRDEARRVYWFDSVGD